MTRTVSKPYFLSLGSNIHPRSNMTKAVGLLKKEFQVKKVSSFYETAPVGPAGSKKFWNAAILIQSPLRRNQLIQKLRKLESRLGRKRNPKNRFLARPIDLDLLPQKGYRSFAFIMIPLAEIAASVRDSGTGKTFGEIAKGFRLGKNEIRTIT